MKENIAKNVLLVMIISFIIGLTLIFLSTSIGNSFGQSVIEARGGAIDTSEYERIINSNTESFRTGGAVLSLVSGLGLLLSGYVVYNEI